MKIILSEEVYDTENDTSDFPMKQVILSEGFNQNSALTESFNYIFLYKNKYGAMLIFKYKKDTLQAIYIMENSKKIVYDKELRVKPRFIPETLLFEDYEDNEEIVYLFPRLHTIIDLEGNRIIDHSSYDIQKNRFEWYEHHKTPAYKEIVIDSLYWSPPR